MTIKAFSKTLFALFLKKQYHLKNHQLRYASRDINNVKPFNSIPGPSSLRPLGPLRYLLPVMGEFGPTASFSEVSEIMYKKYGPIVRLDGLFCRADMVMLFDPEYIEKVFRSQESNPLRHSFVTLEYYREVLRKDKFEGVYGLSTAQGEQWRNFRSKVNPALLKTKLVRVYTEQLEEVSQDFIQRLKRLKDNEEYLAENFLCEVQKWSLESIALVGLGTRLGGLEDNLTADHPACKLMECAKDVIELSFQLEFLPNPWKYFATPAFNKVISTYETQWEVSNKYINEARKQIDERGHDIPEENKSILEKLLAIDDKVAIMMANDMLLAGIDTVAFTITNVLYHLSCYRDKQEKLREEIRSSDGKRYLRACVKESLRIWHVTPSNMRTSDRDHVVGGYHIPPGVNMLAMNEFLSRSDKYYPRPNDFIPERWLADKTDPLYYGNAHPMVTLPFGFGIRSCIGRRIAELEIEILLKKLINEFEVIWEGPPVKVVNTILNTFVKPFHFKFYALK